MEEQIPPRSKNQQRKYSTAKGKTIELGNNNPVVFTFQMKGLNTLRNKKFPLDVARINWKNIQTAPPTTFQSTVRENCV